MSESKQFIELDQDATAVLKREFNKLCSSLGTMVQMATNGELDEEMKETFLKLANYNLEEIQETVGFTGAETDREKEIRLAALKMRDDEIASLKKAIENTSPGAIVPIIKQLYEKLEQWWKIEGFNYLRKFTLLKNGAIKAELGFSLYNFMQQYSSKPVTEDNQRLSKIDDLKEKGYQLLEEKGNDIDLLDNDANRAIFIKELQTAFPSATVFNFESRPARGKRENQFTISGITIIIRDIDNVHNLTIRKVNFVGEDDE
ncbi:hypothetical protein ACOMCU_00550 [Lysinibacillus sp. UGB7]|uniref:hypothetical protein n=1 Tax=Lysinibacillus sp. UGB7 TaxID=3411039 RepID=UPI003B7BDDD6